MNMKLRSALFASALIPTILFQACMASPEGFDPEDGEAALLALEAPNGPKVYIVRFKDGVDADQAFSDFEVRHAGALTHRYRHVFSGGAMLLPNAAAAAAVAQDPRVAGMDRDMPVSYGKPAPHPAPTPAPQKEPTGYKLIGANATSNEGAGVRVAVIETGADLSHPDLAANLDLALAKDCVGENGAPAQDLNGHGSHVSGTIAAVNNTIGSIGVGTAIKVVPVKVLNRRGSGSWSTVICGIDYVTANADVIQVANMSLGGAGSECSTSGCTKTALQIAIEKSVAAGVTYAVAAGNDGANASTQVPAAYDAVITVSAYSDADGMLGTGDGWASFTNFGADVDIAAPGVNIFSTWKEGGYNTISGTSMATPHVAAAAALYLSLAPGSTPEQVKAALIGTATTVYPGSTDAKHAEPLLDVRTF
jgi:subtilisin family serine protease